MMRMRPSHMAKKCSMGRSFLLGICGLLIALFIAPTAAQPAGKVYRIGILSNVPRANLGIKPRIA
jgi:hypothetical protein